MKPELISFKTCPFVRRSVITLLKKKAEFDITYIDLAHKPDWFLKVSPTGKVPVLRLGDEVIFESAVINEYLDEVYPPALHPQDALQRAKNRAWIEFGSSIFMDLWTLVTTESKLAFEDRVKLLKEKWQKLEKVVSGPYFNGAGFGLIDAAFAPAFDQIDLLEQRYHVDFFEKVPKVVKWKDNLLADKEVRASVVDDFEDLYYAYLDKHDKAYLANLRQRERV